MTENKICKGCQYNNYPTCKGTIMDNGNEMNIETLKAGFRCGQKYDVIITDFSIKKKTELELLQDQVEILKSKIENLEKN